MGIFNRKQKDELYVITTIFNPEKYKSRIRLYKEFEKRTLESGAILIVIEACFRGEHPEVVEKINGRHYILHVKAHNELWLKENLINIAIRQLKHIDRYWKYVAWVDADVQFARPNWVKDTVKLLGEYEIVQMFSHVTQLNSKYQPMPGFTLSFMEGWRQGLQDKNKETTKDGRVRYGWSGAPGGAWASTRQFIEKSGGLLDIGILGSGDFHMANALMGRVENRLISDYTDGYVGALKKWQDNVAFLNGRVGMLPGLMLHYWHGSMKDRGYDTRWEIMTRHHYNPDTDIVVDKFGLYSIHPSNQGMIEDIEKYFKSRNEDSE